MDKKISVANLHISPVTKSEFLSKIKSLLDIRKQTFITTPNSEFLFASLRDKELHELFNSADIALADGIAIMWAERYLAMNFRLKGFLLRIIEAVLQVVYTGVRIILTPKYLYKNIPEKITGADVFFDLVKLASDHGHSLFFVNDQLGSAQITADLLRNKHKDLTITVSNKSKDDPTLLDDIRAAQPDILFIAYGQPRQEKWIKQHLPNLPVTIAMGVGGTFDYAAGVKRTPPRWVRTIGLEWLFRLITQPRRWKRILQATLGLTLLLLRYKLSQSKQSKNGKQDGQNPPRSIEKTA